MNERIAAIDLQNIIDLLKKNDLQDDELLYGVSLCIQFRSSRALAPLIDEFLNTCDDLTGGLATATIECWAAPTIH